MLSDVLRLARSAHRSFNGSAAFEWEQVQYLADRREERFAYA